MNATLLEVKLGLELKMALSFWLAFEVEPLDATARPNGCTGGAPLICPAKVPLRYLHAWSRVYLSDMQRRENHVR